ncbi:MAG: NYN domain-containing protein [Candidatus Nomurabacteria bacterium]|nr:MAG: NYN domain-containing protein [Candidatus Nomurabacteria bacterium]HRV75964.1 NYN domain-containing protein [Candidatus Saccharimonadales bacterium]
MNNSRKTSKTVYVFIDASNLWAVQKAKGRMFDLSKLKSFLKTEHNASRIVVYYYDAYPLQKTREYSIEGKFKFYVYLQKALKFIVRKKPLKQIKVTSSKRIVIEEKGNMDVEMAIDFINKIDKYNEAILFSGDSDFLALVRFARNKKKKVYVYSSKNNISSELRTGANGYIDILNLDADIWGKELKHRK